MSIIETDHLVSSKHHIIQAMQQWISKKGYFTKNQIVDDNEIEPTGWCVVVYCQELKLLQKQVWQAIRGNALIQPFLKNRRQDY